MISNRIDAEVTAEKETQVIQYIKDGRAQLGFLVGLSKKEKVRMPKLGAPYLDFTNRVLARASQFPAYLPHQITLEMFQKDARANESLEKILGEVKSFEKDLEDTILLLKAEIYQTARLYYNSVRAAGRSGDKDAERIATELAAHYMRRTLPAPEPEEELKPTAVTVNGAVNGAVNNLAN